MEEKSPSLTIPYLLILKSDDRLDNLLDNVQSSNHFLLSSFPCLHACLLFFCAIRSQIRESESATWNLLEVGELFSGGQKIHHISPLNEFHSRMISRDLSHVKPR